MDDVIQSYQKPINLELGAPNHGTVASGSSLTFSDWLFVKAYVVISLVLLGFLVWKFMSIFG